MARLAMPLVVMWHTTLKAYTEGEACHITMRCSPAIGRVTVAMMF